MKIIFFRLKGYIRVLNGMGLDEIAIPFDTFKNRIILIQGENGCSKSTIISALSPTPDSSDSFRTDVFIDDYGNRQIIEYPAEKEIHYIDTDSTGHSNFYQILIQSLVDDSRTKRTTKAFIAKNGEELNPNGNVTSFKEIRDSVLGIDPIYLDLSSISSENRGIVDMIPSERRKYMAAYIGSLDTYNNIFKVISKKVSNLKSYMNTLNTKIYELGNENELRLKLMQLETHLKNLNEQRDSCITNLADAEATVRLTDPDNKIQDIYSSISDRLEKLNSKIDNNRTMSEQIQARTKVSAEIDNLLSIKEELNTNLEIYNARISENKATIANNINLNEITFNSLESDKTILHGLMSNTIQTNIEEAVNRLREEVKSYEDYLSTDDIKLFKSTSIDELIDLRDTFNKFLSEISSAEELHSKDLYDIAVNYSLQRYRKQELTNSITLLREQIITLRLTIVELEKERKIIQESLAQVQNFTDTRPKECKIDSCPYIAQYMKLKTKKELEKEFEKCETTLFKTQLEKDKLETKLSNNEKIDELIRRIDVSITLLYSKKSIIQKIKSLKPILDSDYLIEKLISFYKFPEFDKVSSLIEREYLYLDLQKAKEQLMKLENDLKIYQNNKALIESLTESIKNNEEIYSTREEEIKTLSDECKFLHNVINDCSDKLKDILALIDLYNDRQNLLQEKENLRQEFNSIKNKIKLISDKINLTNSLRAELCNLENEITPLSNNINQLKYTLSNIVEYQEELKDSSDKYDKMTFIRNACSPGNGLGIQSEYVKRYMNDIIIDCNKMLGYMFGGSIQLDVPVINEKQFSIPFYGPNGIVVPDISNGSTAQKCMIGLVFSCIAMMKSSVKYNIPRFDEIDGGLDQQNRITFINVLNQILDFMHCEQCIICSHNTEFDTQNTSRLLCSKSGILIK